MAASETVPEEISPADNAGEPEAPSEEELGGYLGVEAPVAIVEEETVPVGDGRPLPSLADVEKRIPTKTKALMEELFRAKLEKVQRIDPKEIR